MRKHYTKLTMVRLLQEAGLEDKVIGFYAGTGRVKLIDHRIYSVRKLPAPESVVPYCPCVEPVPPVEPEEEEVEGPTGKDTYVRRKRRNV